VNFTKNLGEQNCDFWKSEKGRCRAEGRGAAAKTTLQDPVGGFLGELEVAGLAGSAGPIDADDLGFAGEMLAVGFQIDFDDGVFLQADAATTEKTVFGDVFGSGKELEGCSRGIVTAKAESGLDAEARLRASGITIARNDAGDGFLEFVEFKRFLKKTDGTEVAAKILVTLAGFTGQDENGNLLRKAERGKRLADFEAGVSGHHQVEKDGVGLKTEREGDAFFGIGSVRDVVGNFQTGTQKPPESIFIVNNQKAWQMRSPRFPFIPRPSAAEAAQILKRIRHDRSGALTIIILIAGGRMLAKRQDSEHDSGHVVAFGAACELLDGAKDGTQKAIRLGVVEHGAEIGKAGHAELVAALVGRLEETVGGNQDSVSGFELETEFFIGRGVEKAGGQAAFAESGAASWVEMKREGEPGVGDRNPESRWIEDGVLAGAIARLNRANPQALVEFRENVRRAMACLLDGTQRADGKRSIDGGGKSFADDVAHVDGELSVVEEEIVEKIAADFGVGADEVGDFEICAAKGLAGKKEFLEEAGFTHC
jgi:hypothetical protein